MAVPWSVWAYLKTFRTFQVVDLEPINVRCTQSVFFFFDKIQTVHTSPHDQVGSLGRASLGGTLQLLVFTSFQDHPVWVSGL